MSVYAGLDGGSTYLKAALIDQSGRVLRTGVKSTGIDNNGRAKVLLQQLCREAGVPAPDYTMATGYSRKILEVADDDVSEITAHAYGVRITAPQGYRPGLIVDIGGQDSKVIYLDDQYRVKNFSMNDKCAAGTGKFMEVIAQILETTIDQVGPISLESTAPCDINSTFILDDRNRCRFFFIPILLGGPAVEHLILRSGRFRQHRVVENVHSLNPGINTIYFQNHLDILFKSFNRGASSVCDYWIVGDQVTNPK